MRHTVMHLIATNFFGGPEKQIVNHCLLTDPHKWKMIVCSFLEGRERNEILDISRDRGIETAVLHTVNPYNPRVLLELVRKIRAVSPDIIVAHGYRALILSLILKPVHGIPVIAYSRGFTAENLKIRLFENMFLILLRYTDLILAVSEGHKRDLIMRGIDGNRIQVIHNAVSVSQRSELHTTDVKKVICERLNIPDETFVVTAGRLSPEKGHKYLVKAIGVLKDRVKGVSFVFCGDGICREELLRLAAELNVDDRCHFVGFRRDINEIFSAMDFLVLPSLTEGLPNVVLEAFAHRKAVIATAVGGIPEVVEDGLSGLLVQPASTESLASAIEKLLKSGDLKQKMGEKGFEMVREHFTFEKQNQNLERVYQHVLSST